MVANQDENFPQTEHIPILRTIKYSGNKIRLLPAIMRIIQLISKPGDTVLDLMAGTHSVGYACKQQYQVYGNDIQEYSYVIGKALIENGGYKVTRFQAEKDLLVNIIRNSKTNSYNLFQKIYANTYFTEPQCIEIDNIRGAIDKVLSPKKELYLSILMSAMCRASNSTGHFAEFLRNEPLHPQSIEKLFFEKCENISVIPNRYRNKVFKVEHDSFFQIGYPDLRSIVEKSSVVYIDPPYSAAQYSRFYHLLETLVKYDYPLVEFKGRYRKDRYFSAFCRKSQASKELDQTMKKCSEICRKFVLLSYVDSNSCLVPKEKVLEIVRSHFKHVTKPMAFEMSHSKLGNGKSKNVTEYLILATNLEKGKYIVNRLNSANH